MFKTDEKAIPPRMRQEVRSKVGERRSKRHSAESSEMAIPGAPAKKQFAALLEAPEVVSWRAMMRAFQTIYHQLERALLVDEDCSISRFQVMFHLYFGGPMPASKIASTLLVTRGNISMFLKRLHADGIIEPVRVNSSLKRPLFALTPKGIAMFEDLFPKHIGRVRRLMRPLPGSALDILSSIIQSSGAK